MGLGGNYTWTIDVLKQRRGDLSHVAFSSKSISYMFA